MPERTKSASIGLLCVSALLLSACASRAAGARDGKAGGTTSYGANSVPNPSVPTTSPMEVYAVPAVQPQNDGTLYLHTAGAATSTDQMLGLGTDAGLNPSTAPGDQATALMLWYSSTSQRTTLGRPGQTSVAVSPDAEAASPGPDGAPLTSLQTNDTQYVQRGDSVVAISNGAVTANYALPTLQPDPTAGTMPPGYKGLYSGAQIGSVSALVPTTSGDVLAFTFTGLAAAVTNLMTGKTVAIPGYGRLGSAVRTPSGNLLVVAWNAQDERKSIQVLSLDPTTYGLTATIDTGLAATNYLKDTLLPGLGYDAVLAVSHGDNDADIAIQVFGITGQTLSSAPSLPNGSGLAITPAGTNSVYVYGGPAQNNVGLLDLNAGSFTPNLPSMQTPAGSYVVGVFS